MPFDLVGARSAGSDDEILGYLKTQNPSFDFDGAMGVGTLDEVVDYLNMQEPTPDTGFVARESESGGDDSVISSGEGDLGGASYGPYQFASEGPKTLQSYLGSSSYGNEFSGLQPKTPEFDAKWKELSTNQDFLEDQKSFTVNQNVNPVSDYITSSYGFNPKDFNSLNELLISTGNQYGPALAKNVIDEAFSNLPDNLTEADIINAVTDAKIRRVDSDFRSSLGMGTSPEALTGRFESEREKLLAMLENQPAQAQLKSQAEAEEFVPNFTEDVRSGIVGPVIEGVKSVPGKILTVIKNYNKVVNKKTGQKLPELDKEIDSLTNELSTATGKEKSKLEKKIKLVQTHRNYINDIQGRSKAWGEAADIAEDTYKRVQYEKYGNIGGLAQDAVEALPAMIAASALSAVGTPAAGALFMGGQIAGGTQEALEEKNVEVERAFKASVVNALMQMPLEYIPLKKLGGIIKGSGAGKMVKGKIAQVLGATASEGITEFLQEYPDAISQIWAETPGKDTKERAKVFSERLGDITWNALRAGAVGMMTGGGIASVGSAANSVGEAYQAQAQKGDVATDVDQNSQEVVEPKSDIPNIDEIIAPQEAEVETVPFEEQLEMVGEEIATEAPAASVEDTGAVVATEATVDQEVAPETAVELVESAQQDTVTEPEVAAETSPETQKVVDKYKAETLTDDSINQIKEELDKGSTVDILKDDVVVFTNPEGKTSVVQIQKDANGSSVESIIPTTPNVTVKPTEAVQEPVVPQKTKGVTEKPKAANLTIPSNVVEQKKLKKKSIDKLTKALDTKEITESAFQKAQKLIEDGAYIKGIVDGNIRLYDKSNSYNIKTTVPSKVAKQARKKTALEIAKQVSTLKTSSDIETAKTTGKDVVKELVKKSDTSSYTTQINNIVDKIKRFDESDGNFRKLLKTIEAAELNNTHKDIEKQAKRQAKKDGVKDTTIKELTQTLQKIKAYEDLERLTIRGKVLRPFKKGTKEFGKIGERYQHLIDNGLAQLVANKDGTNHYEITPKGRDHLNKTDADSLIDNADDMLARSEDEALDTYLAKSKYGKERTEAIKKDVSATTTQLATHLETSKGLRTKIKEAMPQKVRNAFHIAGKSGMYTIETLDDHGNVDTKTGKSTGAFTDSFYNRGVAIRKRTSDFNAMFTKHMRDITDGIGNIKEFSEDFWFGGIDKLKSVAKKGVKSIPKYTYTDKDGNNFEVTKGERVWFYLIAKDADAVRHVTNNKGGIKIRDGKKWKTIKPSPDMLAKISEDVEASPEEMSLAKGVEDWFSKQKGIINGISQRINGKDLATVENYMSLLVEDSALIDLAPEEITLKDHMKMFKEGLPGALKGRKRSTKPLVMENVFETLSRNSAMISKYVGMQDDVAIMEQILSTIKSDFKDNGMMSSYTALDDYVKSFTKRSIPEAKFWVKMMSLNTKGILALNPKSALKQTVSSFLATGYLNDTGVKNVVMSTPKMFVSKKLRKSTLDEMLEHSGYAFERFAKGMEADFLESGKEAAIRNQINKRGIDKVAQTGITMSMLSTMDRIAISLIWNGVKSDLKARGINKSDAKYWDLVDERFIEILQKTQPTSEAETRTQLQKTNWARPLTWFSSQTTKCFQMTTSSLDVLLKVKKGIDIPDQIVRRAIMNLLTVGIFSKSVISGINIMYDMIRGKFKDDDDNEKLKKTVLSEIPMAIAGDVPILNLMAQYTSQSIKYGNLFSPTVPVYTLPYNIARSTQEFLTTKTPTGKRKSKSNIERGLAELKPVAVALGAPVYGVEGIVDITLNAIDVIGD